MPIFKSSTPLFNNYMYTFKGFMFIYIWEFYYVLSVYVYVWLKGSIFKD